MATDYLRKFVEFALNEVGASEPTGDDKYITFYNNLTGTKFSTKTTAWCAIFVTYCARNVGIPKTAIPNFAGCTSLRNTFLRPKNLWKRPSNYTPKIGDLILFDWDFSGNCDHVGIVYDVDAKYVYTVEGNTPGGYKSDGVRKKKYARNSKLIAGYGAIDWKSINDYMSTEDIENAKNPKDSIYSDQIKAFQSWLNTNYDTDLEVDGSYGILTRTAATKALQIYTNKIRNAGIKVDSEFSDTLKNKVLPVRKGQENPLVMIAQGLLYANQYDPKVFGSAFDGEMEDAVKAFQMDKGISSTGVINGDTWEALCYMKPI